MMTRVAHPREWDVIDMPPFFLLGCLFADSNGTIWIIAFISPIN
jgi:hypothetical protein